MSVELPSPGRVNSRKGTVKKMGPTPRSDYYDEGDVQEQGGVEEEDPNGANFPASVFNLSNTILGAGILALPNVMANTGLALGVVLLTLGACGAATGLYLLAMCAVWTGKKHTSYFVLASETYPKARYVIDFAVAFKCFGVATSYLIVVGGGMPEAMIEFGITSGPLADRRVWITAFMLVCVPLGLMQNLRSLRFVSFGALLSVAYLLVMVIYFFFYYKGPENLGKHGSSLVKPAEAGKVLEMLPIIVFSYTCHQNIFSIHSDMRSPSLPKTKRVIGCSVMVCFLCYQLVGFLGYVMLPEEAREHSNILKMLPAKRVSVTVLRIMIALLAAFSFPLQVHPCKTSLDNLLFGHKNALVTDRERDHKGEKRRLVLAWIVCVLTYSLAMAVDSLGLMFAFVGATGSTTLCYLLPGVFTIKMYQQRTAKFLESKNPMGPGLEVDPEQPLKQAKDLEKPDKWVFYVGIGSLVLGTVILLLSNTVIIIAAANGETPGG